MGKRTLTEYSQTPNVNFFLCRRCRTHIALSQDFDYVTEANMGIFIYLVNVQVDVSAYYHRGVDHTLADVYCYTCDNLLGWKLIEVAFDSRIVLDPGTFILYMEKLLFWDGGRMLYAESNEPV